MKKVIKVPGRLLGVVFFLVLAWQFVPVMQQRAETAETFARATLGVEHPVSHTELSDWQLEALLAIQDPNFYRHAGTDFGGGVMNTISQSLCKTLYFDDYRRGRQKLRQSLLARFALDPVISKNDQLDLFLGSVYLGHVDGQAVRGFRQGAAVHFGKSLDELAETEYLALLASLAAPNRIGPHADAEANAEQAGRIARLVNGECSRAGLLQGHRVLCPSDAG